ncbi:MAG: tripartite tricarboxylate transporter TctB family protein [Thermodesulfobacteriota bacterium]
MRKYDILSGLFLLVVSLAILAGSMQLQVGTLTAPGSGFFPLVTGLVLGIFSILIIAQARDTTKEPARFWAPAANRKGIYLAFLFILVYALLLERLGFIVSTTLFFVLFSRFVSGHRWTTAVFFALVTSLATYFVFNLLLHAPLPQGILQRMF